jgi:ectoine hydroxylase-related dioxygenase (phytanoyl-CoA dioxygenase family)
LRRRIDRLLIERADQVDASGGTVYLAGLEDDPVITAALADPAIVIPLRELLGSEPRITGARYRSPKPGGGAQALHRDQPWPRPDGRWAEATVIVGLVGFEAQNGATRIVPGTHLDRVPFVARSVRYHHPNEARLTGPAGSTYVFTGACLHSGTANAGPAERPGIQAMFTA